ncbi:hypothetical protein [Nocardia farcinica]|uniref:hypothetical protein n=1 Tax=Nocardia farcinica TaxID=37329 RepID=UPI0018943FE8|nr:hypothetical protein [Nocardia farcinica]MBF6382642.1 hypothetical protein [Nocardia farcinica]
MKRTRFALATAAVLTAVGVSVTTAPATAAPADAQPISFTAHATDTASIIEIDAGTLRVHDNQLQVTTADGRVVAATPLSFVLDDFTFPIAADIDGNRATLTPQLDPAEAVYTPVALPFEDKAPWKSEYDREQAAWSRMTSTITMGATVGTLIGGIGGGAVGCLLGGIAGATVASATIIGLFGPFIPAAAIGCLGGIIAVGALGTLAGQILVTAPVALGAAIQYFTTVNQPFPAPAK